jgi:1,4-alpha-glucan branching enzyme
MKQMGRELFLMQSSDWQFLMTNRTAEDYAKSRLAAHYEAFKDLRNILKRYRNYGSLAAGDREVLCMLESKDAVFDNIKLQWFEETV